MFPKPKRPEKAGRRGRLRTHARAADDRVTASEALLVLQRDKGCMAVALDPAVRAGVWGPCRGRYGPEPISPHDLAQMTLQHVWRSQADSTKGKRPPSNRAHLLVICAGHHLGGWATSHAALELQRRYLISQYPQHRCTGSE